MQLVHKYPDMEITLTLFNAHISAGKPKLIEHEDIKWITVDEIAQALSDKYGLHVDLDAVISDITVGMQQRTEILKMLKDGK